MITVFPILMWVAAILAAGVATFFSRKPFGLGEAANQVTRYVLIFPLGAVGLAAFIGHFAFPYESAEAIGWAPSPFQREVAFANLGIAAGCFYAAFAGRAVRIAAALLVITFMVGSGFGHLSDMADSDSFASGSAGSIVFAYFLAPVVLLAFMFLSPREKAAAEPAAAAKANAAAKPGRQAPAAPRAPALTAKPAMPDRLAPNLPPGQASQPQAARPMAAQPQLPRPAAPGPRAPQPPRAEPSLPVPYAPPPPAAAGGQGGPRPFQNGAFPGPAANGFGGNGQDRGGYGGTPYAAGPEPEDDYEYRPAAFGEQTYRPNGYAPEGYAPEGYEAEPYEREPYGQTSNDQEPYDQESYDQESYGQPGYGGGGYPAEPYDGNGYGGSSYPQPGQASDPYGGGYGPEGEEDAAAYEADPYQPSYAPEPYPPYEDEGYPAPEPSASDLEDELERARQAMRDALEKERDRRG